MKIPLIKPYITEEIKQKVMDVLDSGYLTEGPVTKEFETAFSKYIGCDHAIAVTSCTTGLELALRAMGIGPGDEVIVPDYTYPATASVVAIVGAHCKIVDINPSTMLIDYEKLEKAITTKTKVIIPVSLFGNPLDYDKLNQIKADHKLSIIEDAACSIGAEYNGKKVGNQADISVFSLHPRKFITTGEGGMVTTNNTIWAEWMNSYKHFGMNMNNTSREEVSFVMPGTNYKLTNIQSAVGLGQLADADMLLFDRRTHAGKYDELFHGLEGVSIPLTTPGGNHSYQSYCVFTSSRDRIMKDLKRQGIETQIGTYSLHKHVAFQNENLFTIDGDMKGSKQAYQDCLTLPLYYQMGNDTQHHIFDKISELL